MARLRFSLKMLASLDPRWLARGAHHRYGMGVEFQCPAHGDHYVQLWFYNPCDSYPPLNVLDLTADDSQPAFVWRIGAALDGLTLMSRCGEQRPLSLCAWTGWIIDGEVWEFGTPTKP